MEKRRQIHEKMFEMNRQWIHKDFNVLALIPNLIEENAFVEIESILDDINLDKCDTEILNSKVKSQIFSIESTHVELSVCLTMLRLLNRLNLWKK